MRWPYYLTHFILCGVSSWYRLFLRRVLVNPPYLDIRRNFWVMSGLFVCLIYSIIDYFRKAHYSKYYWVQYTDTGLTGPYLSTILVSVSRHYAYFKNWSPREGIIYTKTYKIKLSNSGSGYEAVSTFICSKVFLFLMSYYIAHFNYSTDLHVLPLNYLCSKYY